MNINHQCWRFPALLERREGIDQPTRRGSNADIRAELRKLLGITDRPVRAEGAWAGNTGQGGARPSHSTDGVK